jgi:hypothetical protein
LGIISKKEETMTKSHNAIIDSKGLTGPALEATKPGCLLPNHKIGDQLIHEKLSQTHWTLIVCGKEKIKFQIENLKILHVPENTYSSRYILIRPDWHIASTENVISQILLKKAMGLME